MQSIAQEELELNDAPSLVWVLVQDAVKLLWVDNPKLHDLQGVANSIEKHGFQMPSKFDKNLMNVMGEMGAFKAGNGRIEALAWMEQNGAEPPRGIGIHKKTGAWVMPILVGTDAESQGLAMSYAIDDNNLTMLGGDFTAYDMARLWSIEGYLEILKRLAVDDILPVSVTGDDLDFFLSGLQLDIPDLTGLDEEGIGEARSFSIMVGNPLHLEEILTQVRELLDSHAEWEAVIRL